MESVKEHVKMTLKFPASRVATSPVPLQTFWGSVPVESSGCDKDKEPRNEKKFRGINQLGRGV
jgi:hypothetical protein